MQKRVILFHMCRTMAQTLPFTHTYMSVCKQEGKHERMYTRFLTLINFWREHGNGEMGEGERRDSQARIRLYSEKITCASMQNWICLNIKKLIFSFSCSFVLKEVHLYTEEVVHTVVPPSDLSYLSYSFSSFFLMTA